jgi:hypothetical protein
MIFTGLDGQLCACADTPPSATRAKSATSFRAKHPVIPFLPTTCFFPA